jgi:hypothetical protein
MWRVVLYVDCTLVSKRNIRTFGEFQGSDCNYRISSHMPITITMESSIGRPASKKRVEVGQIKSKLSDSNGRATGESF